MKKRIRNISIFLFAVGVFFVWFANFWIEYSSAEYLYDDIDKIPHNKFGILLGTSRRLTSGEPNLFFQYRIQAAVDLYNHKKIDRIIASGDNSTKYYNETRDMCQELLKFGVPDSVISVDIAGVRTFNSMIRIKEIFGQDSITVISQEFHNSRAVYIARKYGVSAIGYNSESLPFFKGFFTYLREKLARVRVFWDLMTGTSQKHLEEKIEI